MGTLIVLLATAFLVIMLGSFFLTLAWYWKNGMIRRWNRRRPEQVEIVYGEVVEETTYSPQLEAHNEP